MMAYGGNGDGRASRARAPWGPLWGWPARGSQRERERRRANNRDCQSLPKAAVSPSCGARIGASVKFSSGAGHGQHQALSPERLVSRRLGARGRAEADRPDDLRDGHRPLPPRRRRASPRSRTPAGTACCRSRWEDSRATRSSAATTAWCSIRPAAALTCRRRRRSTPRLACAPIRSSNGIVSSGCGRAIRRSPIPRGCPISTGTTAREWKGEGGTFYSLKCDWRLVVDNLMDLTHETYVHSDSIGHDAILDTPFDVTHGDHTATMTRWMIDIEPPPFWAQTARQAGQGRPLADRHLPGPCGGGWRRRRRAGGNGRPAGRPLAGRQRRLSRRDRAGDGDELPLFLEFRPHLPHRRR